MAERREALDSVVNQIDSKVSDLDQRLKRFSALLSETFEAAEGRARDIARVLAEASTEGTKAIANQYELVRVTTDEERKRTSEALHSIYEQATGETSALFRQTSERFIEIVRQMKEMSAAMQREMEQTRTELRKGILELPQETAESAAQMRRVIVEQIDALAELNRIVARHGGATVEQQPARRAEPVAASRARGDADARRNPPEAASRSAAAAAVRRRAAASRRRNPSRRRRAVAGAAGWATCSAVPRARRASPRPRRDSRQARRAMESLELAVGRYRPHDRSRRGGRAVGALQARRAQRVHAPALHDAGPEDVRGDPQALSQRPRVQADGRPLHRRSSSGCWTRSRRTSAARRPRAAISPRTPARSTPCWRTPPAASSRPPD